MKHRLMILLALGSASACAWLVSACSGSDNTTVDGGNDATTSDVATSDTGTTDTGTTDTGTNKDGAVVPDAGCTKGFNCQQCCANAYPDAAAFFEATEQQCACTTPGDCKTACGNTLCQGKQASFMCNGCLTNKDAGDCRAAAVTACLNDTQCAALAACVASCGPAPGDAGGGG